MARVIFSPRASAMLDKLDARWGAEHGGADNPLLIDIHDAIVRLAEFPLLGVIDGVPRRKIFRKLLLQKPWHLYYTYDERSNVVEISSIQYARRRKALRR